eukprot:GHVQ01014321.1.p1 GENE.GHVQ01014321.1~~GHVQ01014321.1.p1  ORF type:complete len:108 (+),score=6.90 GHVQ01014321.1:123-446(+)
MWLSSCVVEFLCLWCLARRHGEIPKQQVSLSLFSERRSLANARTEGSDEVILMEGHVSDWGEYLTEGLSSNFFMVRSDGSLETADSTRVLSGTVREKICALTAGSSC